MFKITAIVILGLAFYVAADPILRKSVRRQTLARQQIQPTVAPSGYPAAGVTPEIPFELPTESEKPDVVAQQPDEVYGPPELNAQQDDELEIEAKQIDEVYGPPEGEVQQLDEVYGPPESDTVQPAIVFSPTETEIITEIEEPEENVEELAEDEEVIIDEDGTVVSVSSTFEKPSRLVYQRFPQKRQSPKSVPARLTNAKFVRPANFLYTARYQNFQRTN